MKQLFTSISFIIFIIVIIILANLGYGPSLWGFLNNIPQGDKIGHFILYGLMTLSLERIFNFKHLGIGTIITVIFVIAEEISQIYLNTRTFSLADIFWSIAGITLFEIILLTHLFKIQNRKSNQ